eukprot:m.586871 g.586871  ORF g.586871 m.586871 type:complete len:594 (-) comp22348_c0_seq1:854-2635(-)
MGPCDGWVFSDIFGTAAQYFYSSNSGVSPRTFNEAEAYCQTMGAHLTSVTSQAENAFIAGLEPSNPLTQARWVGLRRNRADDSNQYPFTFVGINGTGSTYAYELSFACQPGVRVPVNGSACAWQPGEPNDFPCLAADFPCRGQDDCVAMGGSDATAIGQWQDLQCKNVLPFVCARPTPGECVPTTSTPSTTTSTSATTFSCEAHCAKLYVGEDALFPPTKTSSSSSTESTLSTTTGTSTTASTSYTSTTTTKTFSTISSTISITTVSTTTLSTRTTTTATTVSATSQTVTTLSSTSQTATSVSSTTSTTTATSMSSTSSSTDTTHTDTSATSTSATTNTDTSTSATIVTLSTCEMYKCGLCCQGVCGWKSSINACVVGQRTTVQEETAGDCTNISTPADCPVLNLAYLGPPPTEAPDPCHATPCARCCRSEDGCGWSRKNNRCETGQFTSPAEFGQCNSNNGSVCTSCSLACGGTVAPGDASLAPTPPPSPPATEEDCNAIICAACCRGDCGWKSNVGECRLNQKTTTREIGLCDSRYNTTECDDCVLSCPNPVCGLITCSNNCRPPCGWSSATSSCTLGGHTRQDELGLGTC